MKKGIVHILESVLVSLIFIMVVPFLLYPVLVETDWNYAQITLNGQDFLATLDKVSDMPSRENLLQNIMERNSSELQDDVGDKFFWLRKKKLNYAIKTSGTIKNEIRIGFNCTGVNCYLNDPNQEIEYLEHILRPAFINGRYVYFRVFPFSYDRINSYQMDVLLIRGAEQRDETNSNYISQITELTNRGVGVVGFYNVSALGQLEREFFGLVSSNGFGNLRFVNTNDASKPNYAIQKYFYGVGLNQNFTVKIWEHETTQIILWGETYNVTRNDTNPADGIYEGLDLDTDGDEICDLFGKSEGYNFSITSPSGPVYNFTIEKIDPDGEFFILNFKRETPYIFEDFFNALEPDVKSDKDDSYDVIDTTTITGRSGVVLNGTDRTTWRAAWISEGRGDDIYALLKSSIMWVSERKWDNILRRVSSDHTKISYFVSQGEEFHEPYWTELSIWYVY